MLSILIVNVIIMIILIISFIIIWHLKSVNVERTKVL